METCTNIPYLHPYEITMTYESLPTVFCVVLGSISDLKMTVQEQYLVY